MLQEPGGALACGSSCAAGGRRAASEERAELELARPDPHHREHCHPGSTRARVAPEAALPTAAEAEAGAAAAGGSASGRASSLPPAKPLTCLSFAPSGGGRVLLVGDSTGCVSALLLCGVELELAASEAAAAASASASDGAPDAGGKAVAAAVGRSDADGDDGGAACLDVLSAVALPPTADAVSLQAQLLALVQAMLPIL